MSVADDFRCMCGEPLIVDWEHCPPATRYDEPIFRSYPIGLEVLEVCPGCGADLEEMLLAMIEQEERDYGERWAGMVKCGTVVKPREGR